MDKDRLYAEEMSHQLEEPRRRVLQGPEKLIGLVAGLANINKRVTKGECDEPIG